MWTITEKIGGKYFKGTWWRVVINILVTGDRFLRNVNTFLCGASGFACCVDYFYCSCLGPPNAKFGVWGTPVSLGGYSFLSNLKTVQPQVRLILPIFNRPRTVFVNLNSQVFFVP